MFINTEAQTNLFECVHVDFSIFILKNIQFPFLV